MALIPGAWLAAEVGRVCRADWDEPGLGQHPLRRDVLAGGDHAALLFSVEDASPWGEDISAVELSVLDAIRQEANRELPAQLRPPQPGHPVRPGASLTSGLGINREPDVIMGRWFAKADDHGHRV